MKDMMDFMNAFINSGELKVDEEMFELEQKYFEMFHHGVPREMIPPSISQFQIKEAVIKCIETGKDNLFELLGVTVDYRNLY